MLDLAFNLPNGQGIFNFNRKTILRTLLKPTDRIVLITEKGNAEYSILRLIRIGYTNIEGYLTGGFE